MSTMTTSPFGTYTAKLTDGPLEGRTIATDFLEGGDPQPRIQVPAGSKYYLYVRAPGLEFADDADEAAAEGRTPRPTAVAYRYLETVVI